MKTSAITKILTVTRSTRQTSGRASRKYSGLKKVSCTTGHPGDRVTTRATTTKNTTVEREATMVLRRAVRRATSRRTGST